MNGFVARRAQRSFSRSFPSYHARACEQARIADDLARRLSELGAPETFGRAFEIGCGTGHLTQALLRRFTISSLTLNDLLPEAADVAHAAGARFLPGDARTVAWPDAPDLIASASTIQWLDDPQAFMKKAARCLAPGGWLAISGFGTDQFRELRDLGSTARAPGLCQPEAMAGAIRSGGGDALDVLDVRQEHRRMWFENPTQVLKHLRQTGVNATASRIWTRHTLKDFNERYVRTFGASSGRVPLSYNPVLVIARKRA
ncbi:biotin synthase [Maritimibacter sp. 55A14]|uniref:methyltransferase domain-containing protein n=1 Tax=Maritimibacter sp. 55A14 TaxID=2174844 RepID=UPI000D619858|nr:methyltransferase domain-containing protein [Maritimibacter sp. 55A14]PWE32959.1 biotin synthase [Maritimibacter sp. 55A14]